MTELAAGALSPMQTWIIVSGDVRAESTAAAGFHYILTDPAVPNALLRITSRVELPVGQTTVSGTIIGGAGRALDDFGWLGNLRADAVPAHEQNPPWVVIALALCAVLVLLLARTSYPMFFRDEPKPPAAQPRRLHVGVRRDWPPTAGAVTGTLELDPRRPAQLHLADGETRQLRLHSAKSSLEVGGFHRLSSFEPALVLRAAGGDLTLTFASADDRDGAYAALLASLAMPRRG